MYDLPAQAGLEVVRAEHDSGLQVADGQDGLYSVQTEHEYYSKPEAVAEANAEVVPSFLVPRKRRNVKKILLICAGVLLVIVGVVVGAVVGTRPKSTDSTKGPPSSSDNQGSNGSPPEAQMTGSPTSVASGLYPTAVSWGYPHLEIYALTNNSTQSVYRKFRNANATSDQDWVPGGKDMEVVGGSVDIERSPSLAISHRLPDGGTTNRTEFYIRGGDGHSYQKHHDSDQIMMPSGTDTWGYWFNGNDKFVPYGAPTVARLEPSLGLARLFYLSGGDNGGLAAWYYRLQDPLGWFEAVQIPGPRLQLMTPSIVVWNGDESRFDVFAVSADNSHLLHTWWDNEVAKWQDYEDLHGCVTAPPVAISRTPSTLDVFARGGDGGLWYLAFADEKWSEWTRISGDTKIQGQPDVINIDANSLDVFAWGEDGSMLHKRLDIETKTWTPEDNDFEVLVTDGLSGPPKAVIGAPGQIYVFAYSDNNELVQKTLESLDVRSSALVIADVPMVR